MTVQVRIVARPVRIWTLLLVCVMIHGQAQDTGNSNEESDGWNRTRMILDCAPRLVDRSDRVEDNFDHRYVTNNPRDIEVGYFSVEPVTFLEEGRRFCEALLPAAGVSQSFFRGSYITSYQLPGDGVYVLNISSNALIFNNDIRMINAQNTVGEIVVSHRMELELDTTLNPPVPGDAPFISKKAYTWELEIDHSGSWQGDVLPGDFKLYDSEVPSGSSLLNLEQEIRGPGVVTIRESIIFEVSAISSFKYEPIFQAACLFSLEPLSISARVLPCE